MTVVPVDGLNEPRFADYRNVPDPAPVLTRNPEPLSAIADAARRLIPFPTSMPALKVVRSSREGRDVSSGIRVLPVCAVARRVAARSERKP